MDIFAPRMVRISAGSSDSRSRPSNMIFPEMILPGGGTRLRMESAVTVLPHPDSPTSPRTRPFGSLILRLSTALITPDRVKKCVVRPCMSRRSKCEAPSGILRFYKVQVRPHGGIAGVEYERLSPLLFSESVETLRIVRNPEV